VKREQESQPRPLRARRNGAKDPTFPSLLQVHPVPTDPDEILAITMHLLVQSAAAQGKATPILSQDAALFLTRQRWALSDLAFRVARAVAYNEGSLITAEDLA
jgi:transcriptional regulator of aromatic amino acid metabolism